jgi:NAD(P)H-flavin reductase
MPPTDGREETLDETDLAQRIDTLVEAAPPIPLETDRAVYPATIDAMWDEGAAYLGIRVRVPEPLRPSFTSPGQYVTVQLDDLEPRFLVIANGPTRSDEGWEFLVDQTTELGQAVAALKPGDSISISGAEGPGYPMGQAAGADVLCFVTGSGVASIRPAMHLWEDRPEEAPGSVTIYYGESASPDFAFQREFDAWRDAGATVYRCAADLADAGDGHRYVQHAFEAHDPDLRDVVVFLSGAPVMKRAVADRLLRRGVPLQSIATNMGDNSSDDE